MMQLPVFFFLSFSLCSLSIRFPLSLGGNSGTKQQLLIFKPV